LKTNPSADPKGAVMRRVLIGEFGDIATMALRHVLEEEGLTVVGEAAGAAIVPLVEEVRPDVLLLDNDHPATDAIAAEVCARLPEVTVIAWSANEPLMRVYPVRHGGESQVSPLTVELFKTALKGDYPGPVSLAGLAALSRRAEHAAQRPVDPGDGDRR
jgi:CheY-like chemotaxis protein